MTDPTFKRKESKREKKEDLKWRKVTAVEGREDRAATATEAVMAEEIGEYEVYMKIRRMIGR